MPDFNIKDIAKLRQRIKNIERITLVGVVLTVAAFYYDQHPIAEILCVILIALYVAKKILGKRLRQKEYLAKVVEEQTIELRVQRDQVLMESEKLSAALAALAEAQDELVRSERFATVGLLTKGLVDRILNPLNYINNFAGLSVELIQDLEKNLREEAVPTKETYDETLEVVGMISGNLAKIGEHGANTVRIVKAMEELLKDRKGKMVATDINNLCKVNIDVIAKLFAKEIEEKQIHITFNGLTLALMIDLNIEQMSKALLHILKNSVYALLKKASKEPFTPELSVGLEKQDAMIAITIHDNGTGLEDSIKDKIFEPFFTTKPTAEAAGIGLYITREAILNHKGTIEVKSEKNHYCEITITIPIHQNTENTDNTENNERLE
ncbi:MAG: HAMP domain-containing histidine kinase [Tannerellaceae bacterium]|jgi:signal transduction histidine kinase|nr:HAMP domain-containing histidine kinase [Tannerellaceae bacterium]